MEQSSDETIKREIIDVLGHRIGKLRLRIFPESSKDDQRRFEDGGLTFSSKGVGYGSCDACWYAEDLRGAKIPVVALEATDALNRKSSGNAQYQRFHHALGAVKNNLVGVYYLKKGIDKIQPDLFGMAYYASKVETGSYLVVDNLEVVSGLLKLYGHEKAFSAYVNDCLEQMRQIFRTKFDALYKGDWKAFAERRSTIIKGDYIIKHAGRMRRNFTDSSQRAGHVAVGEMYLTKYFFYDKKFYYLFPKMTRLDLERLDKSKVTDKEWFLLRNEPNVEIKTMDDIRGLPEDIRKWLLVIQDEPLKGTALRIYNQCVGEIVEGLKKDTFSIK